MKRNMDMRRWLAGWVAGLLLAQAGTAAAADLAPLPVKLPEVSLKATPEEVPAGPHIEPPLEKAPPPFMAPKGVVNAALKKPVTASDANPITGALEQVTDGQKEAFDDQVVQLRRGVQWVQVDLQGVYRIYALVLWHDHQYVQTYAGVIVQIADDAEFTQNVRTLFNNDFENKAGLGVGRDRQYFESLWGRTIDGKGATARYVRWYSQGSNMSRLNHRTEIEVYALPAK